MPLLPLKELESQHYWTNQLWVTCFQEHAEVILGKSAEELGSLFTSNIDEYCQVFQDAAMKEYKFRMRAQEEYFKDEKRVRHTVRGISNVDIKEKTKACIRYLEENRMALPDGFNQPKYV